MDKLLKECGVKSTDALYCTGRNLGKAMVEFIDAYSKDIVRKMKAQGLNPGDVAEVDVPEASHGKSDNKKYRFRYTENGALEIERHSMNRPVWVSPLEPDVLDEIGFDRIDEISDIWFMYASKECLDMVSISVIEGCKAKYYKQTYDRTL